MVLAVGILSGREFREPGPNTGYRDLGDLGTADRGCNPAGRLAPTLGTGHPAAPCFWLAKPGGAPVYGDPFNQFNPYLIHVTGDPLVKRQLCDPDIKI